MSELPLPPARLPLGDTGLSVSPIAWGMWRLAEGGRSATEASRLVHAALDAGINAVDTADVYSRWAPGNKGGESETVLGAWMAARKASSMCSTWWKTPAKGC